jgi:ferredoxin-type protein NapF
MSVRLSRRVFVTGMGVSGRVPLRPPWSRAEGEFTDACTRCGDCLRACPEGILSTASGGFPEVDFTAGGCTFCGACVDACEPGALVRSAGPWSLTPRIGEDCLGVAGVECRVCAHWCDAGAIRFPAASRPTPPIVDQQRCIRCGACVAPCPTGAVTLTAEKDASHA